MWALLGKQVCQSRPYVVLMCYALCHCKSAICSITPFAQTVGQNGQHSHIVPPDRTGAAGKAQNVGAGKWCGNVTGCKGDRLWYNRNS